MKRIIAFIFTYTSILACVNAQEINSDFFRTKTVKDLIIYCGNNEDSALCLLAHVIQNDSTLGSSVWYYESCARSIPVELKGYYGADKYAVSLKMKVFYWMIQIYYDNYYNPNTVCKFLDKINKPVLDMCLIDNCFWNSTEDVITNPPVYQEYKGSELKSIESLFEEWMNKYNQYGLEYLRNRNHPPIPLEMWELCVCPSVGAIDKK